MTFQVPVNSSSSALLKDLYARMLLTRIVDNYACLLEQRGYISSVASCRGHEAAQVGSAVCIEVGKDFTLPYYRDLGVVLTIGMTPYEVFRSYLQSSPRQPVEISDDEERKLKQHSPSLHWSYLKRNMVAGSHSVATQILHAAGIAFAAKLRKAGVVTIAYCGDGATGEADFLEGITFAAKHQLPVVFICEQYCPLIQTDRPTQISCTQDLQLPAGLEHIHIDGSDILAVHSAMLEAMQHAREGQGPVLLELRVHRSQYESTPLSNSFMPTGRILSLHVDNYDPLLRCQRLLQALGLWEEDWFAQLEERMCAEVERAMQDALQDI